VDEALTFVELRKMTAARGIEPDAAVPSEFDPPHSRGGGLFPISGGMLQVAGIQEDLVTGHVMVGEGPAEFAQAIKEAESGLLDTRLLEILFCKGCTMGPGMSSDLPHFGRRARRQPAVRERIASSDLAAWEAGVSVPRPSTQARHPDDMRLRCPHEQLTKLPGPGKPDPRTAKLRRAATQLPRAGGRSSADWRAHRCLPHGIEHLRNAVQDQRALERELAGAQVASRSRSSRAWASWLPDRPRGEQPGVVIICTSSPSSSPANRSPGDVAMVGAGGPLQEDRSEPARFRQAEQSGDDLIDSTSWSARPEASRTRWASDRVEHARGPTGGGRSARSAQVLVNLSNLLLPCPTAGGKDQTEGDAGTVRLTCRHRRRDRPSTSRNCSAFFTTKQGGKGTAWPAVTWHVKMHRSDINLLTDRGGPTERVHPARDSNR
jgi:hypothetical protein